MTYTLPDHVVVVQTITASQLHFTAQTVGGDDLGVILILQPDGSLNRPTLSPAALAVGFQADVDGGILTN